jgi:ribose transport system substrate-binding protein
MNAPLLRAGLVGLALMSAEQVTAKDITIGYAVMGYNHPLFQAMMRGAKQAADKIGVKLEMVDAQFDVNKQIAQIQDFTTRKVDVLLVNPVTAKETVPALKKARDAGIPVVAIDTRPVGFDPDAFVSMNHYQGGYVIGWKVAIDLNCKGTWAPIWAIGNEQAASRMRGFEAGMDEACRVHGLKNEFKKEGEYSGITGPLRETSRKIAETLLTKYPSGQLALIFGQTDEFANGAYLATQAAGREDVKIYGMDNNDDMRAFLKEGKNMIATTAHLPVEVGEMAVQTSVNVVEKKPFLKEVQLNFQLVDQKSVEFDPGWEGTYKPSFSEFAFPQQLGVLSVNTAK